MLSVIQGSGSGPGRSHAGTQEFYIGAPYSAVDAASGAQGCPGIRLLLGAPSSTRFRPRGRPDLSGQSTPAVNDLGFGILEMNGPGIWAMRSPVDRVVSGGAGVHATRRTRATQPHSCDAAH